MWVSVRWGREMQRTAPEIFLGAAPLVGRNFRDGWDWRFGWGLVGAVGVGVATIVGVHRGWFLHARLRAVVLVSSVGAGLFGLFLALTDGVDGVLFGAADDAEYLANLDIAPPAGEFVRTFVERIDDYSVHVRGHPPGFLLILKFFDAVGLDGAWPAAMISVLSAVALPAGVLVAVRAVAGPTVVRQVAPFLVVAPYAIWMVTSADAFYAALGAWGVALVALGLRSSGGRALAWGTAGGVLLATLLFMTYGGALFMTLPLVIAVTGWMSRRPGTTLTVIGAVAGAATVTGLWAAAGFWWFDGAAAVQDEYWEGTAQFRIWNYFIFANLAAALFAVGPATFVGLTQLKDRRLWILVGGGLAALIAADLSQLSKGEVERIWLIFYPWIVLAGASFAVTRRRALWPLALAVQTISAVLVQAALVSKW